MFEKIKKPPIEFGGFFVALSIFLPIFCFLDLAFDFNTGRQAVKHLIIPTLSTAIQKYFSKY